MGAETHETRVTRFTRAIGSVTSIFRCHGLQSMPSNADPIGGHDLLYWIGFLLLLSGWFLFAYMPQCQRYERLIGRQQGLSLELGSEKKQLARLNEGINSLHNGDALAWERATRKRLGWLEPGEVLDAGKWQASSSIAVTGRSSTGIAVAPRLVQPAPVLPRPRLPQIPHPQHSVPSGFSHIRSPSGLNPPPFADCGALGPTAAVPPAPPPAPTLPALPQRLGVSMMQRVSMLRP